MAAQPPTMIRAAMTPACTPPTAKSSADTGLHERGQRRSRAVLRDQEGDRNAGARPWTTGTGLPVGLGQAIAPQVSPKRKDERGNGDHEEDRARDERYRDSRT